MPNYSRRSYNSKGGDAPEVDAERESTSSAASSYYTTAAEYGSQQDSGLSGYSSSFLEEAEEKRYTSIAGEMSFSQSQSFFSITESHAKSNSVAKAAEHTDKAVAAYREHLQAEYRKQREQREREQAARTAESSKEADAAEQSPYSAAESPYTVLESTPYGAMDELSLTSQSFDMQFSLTESQMFSESGTPGFHDVSKEDALAWWSATFDPIVKAQRQNSLMGWEKVDGRWSNTGAAPEVLPAAKGMKAGHGYENEQEDATKFRGAARTWTSLADTENANVKGINTHYLDEQEKKDATVSVQDGKLVGADGKNVHTLDASGTGTQFNEGKRKFIYAKDKDGTMRAIDPWAAHKETDHKEFLSQKAAAKEGKPKKGGRVSSLISRFEAINANGGDSNIANDIQMSFVNHSSLVGGEEARAAGEILVNDGEVEMVNDSSGHYQPDNAMTYDMVQGLVEGGVSAERLQVGMVAKNADDKNADGSRKDAGAGQMRAGALEFLSYGGATDAEEKMRKARKDRHSIFDEIKGFNKGGLNKTNTQETNNVVVDDDVREQPKRNPIRR